MVRPNAEETFALAADIARCRTAAATLISALPLQSRWLEWLDRRYRYPGLPYHGAAHVGLLWLRHLAHEGAPDDVATALAITFHDAVYRPGARNNEALSAAMLKSASAPSEETRCAIAAVLATADHLSYSGGDPCVQRMLDLDLSPLAEDPPIFDRNTDALRLEAAAVPNLDWPGQERRLLARLQAGGPLFRSEFAGVYERRAQQNLARLALRLGSSSPPTTN